MTENPMDVKVEKGEDGSYDFSALETPMFNYSLTGPDGEKINFQIDMDGAVIALTSRMPMLFSVGQYSLPVIDDEGNAVYEDGKIKTELKLIDGITALFMYSTHGMRIPDSLPRIEDIVANVKKVFSIPENCGVRISMGLFNTFFTEYGTRFLSKKNGTDLPDSCVPTPEPSDTAT